MEVAKDTVLSFIDQRGDTDRLTQARETLPDPVDTDRDAVLLAQLGVEVDDIDDAEGPNLSPSQADRDSDANREAAERDVANRDT